MSSGTNADAGYPKDIYGNWGIPYEWRDGIDCAFYSEEYGAIYMIKGNEYTKFWDGTSEPVSSSYPGDLYPTWDIHVPWVTEALGSDYEDESEEESLAESYSGYSVVDYAY